MIYDAIYQARERDSLSYRQRQAALLVEELGTGFGFDLYRLFEEAVNRGIYSKNTCAVDARSLLNAIRIVSGRDAFEIYSALRREVGAK